MKELLEQRGPSLPSAARAQRNGNWDELYLLCFSSSLWSSEVNRASH